MSYSLPSPIYKNLGRKLKEAREQCGLSLLEAERLTGVSKPNISAYESGRRCVSLRTLEKLLTEYGFEIEILLKEDLT